MSASDIAERYRHAFDVVVPAARALLSPFRKGVTTFEGKSDGSPVTEWDRKTEVRLRDQILARFPDDSVVGEEFGESAGSSSYRWVIDPIDGTQSFTCGVPLFGTLLGVFRDHQPVIGVAYFPAVGELISAAEGRGTWWNNQVTEVGPVPMESGIRVRCHKSFDANKSVINTTTFNYYQQTHTEKVFHSLLAHGSVSRGWSDMYGVMLALTGRVDLAVEPLVAAWAVAPFFTIAQEAGFALYDFFGKSSLDIKSCVAGHPAACRWFHESITI